MKNAILIITSALILAGTTLADVKVKTKQTTGGQTMENTTYIKGKRQRTEMAGGMMVTLMECDLNRDVQLNPQTKTYMVTSYDDSSAPVQGPTVQTKAVETTKGGVMYVTTTIKDTGERKQMFGYTARHIIQTIETESSADSCNPTRSKMEMDMWVIDAEFGLQCNETRRYLPYKNSKNGGCQDRIEQKTIGTAKSGYPVYQKMTSTDPSGQSFSMISEVVEFSKATLDQNLFEIPADYREVKDAAAMYAAAPSSSSGVNYNGGSTGSTSTLPGVSTTTTGTSSINTTIQSVNSAANTEQPSAPAKKAGTVRIGVSVKTTAVGEGISPNDLSLAIQNSLAQYVKGTKIEIVPLEAKLAAAIPGEAKEKQCDYVLFATVAHKKGGGGGFGFGKALGSVAQSGLLNMGGMGGGVAGAMAGHAATTAIITATSISGNVKSKDELTLDLKVNSTADNSQALAKQYKAKAKSDGEDIISQIIEQAATAIVETLGS